MRKELAKAVQMRLNITLIIIIIITNTLSLNFGISKLKFVTQYLKFHILKITVNGKFS